MPLIRVEGLGLSPLDAAARFYAEVAPRLLGGVARPVVDGPDFARTDQARALTLLFSPADHTHRGWQEAAVASLALASKCTPSSDSTPWASARTSIRWEIGAP